MGREGPTTLQTLQRSIFQDPQAFESEYKLQLAHFRTLLELEFYPSSVVNRRDPTSIKNVKASLAFLIATAAFYPEQARELGTVLQKLLAAADSLPRAILTPVLQSLFTLSRRKLMDGDDLINSTLPLAAVPSQELRSQLFELLRAEHKAKRDAFPIHIFQEAILSTDTCVQDRQLKIFVIKLTSTIAQDPAGTEKIKRKAVEVLSAVIQQSPDPKLCLLSMGLFIDERTYDEESDNEGRDLEPEKRESTVDLASLLKTMGRTSRHRKLTSSKKAKLTRKMRTIKKKMNENDETGATKLKAARGRCLIDLMHDPHKTAEAVMKNLNGKFKLEPWLRRLVMLRFVSCVIEQHHLFVPSFYPYIVRYLKPHIESVDVVLIALIRGTHYCVDGEVLQGIVSKLVDEWIQDWSQDHVLVAGLRTLRELVIRCPWCVDKEIIQHATSFKKRAKAVMMVVRGLINTCREVRPDALRKKDLGAALAKSIALGKKQLKSARYGEQNPATGVEGLEELDNEGNASEAESDSEAVDSDEASEIGSEGDLSECQSSGTAVDDFADDDGESVGDSDGVEDRLGSTSSDEDDDSERIEKHVMPRDQREILSTTDFEMIDELRADRNSTLASQLSMLRNEPESSNESEAEPNRRHGNERPLRGTTNRQKQRLQPVMLMAKRRKPEKGKKRKGKQFGGHQKKPKRRKL